MLTFAAISPHPPIILPSVGSKEDREKVKTTIESLEFLGGELKKAGYEILKAFISLGGTISGEHGIGVEKRVAMAWLYDTKTLNFFKSLKLVLFFI